MFKKLSLCALLATASSGSLLADYASGEEQWRVTAEYLYLAPSVDDTYFVIDSPVTTTFPNGKRKNNDFNFHSGYRVGGGYLFCDRDRGFDISYSHLSFKQSKTVTGDFLWATNGRADFASSFENYTGTASSNLKFLYQNIDAFYGHKLYDSCGLDFSVQFGLEAAELRLKEGYAYQSGETLGTIDQHSKARGIGPKIGFAINYELLQGSDCCPGTLSLNVLTSGSLLAANNKVSAENILAGATTLDVSNSDTWRVIPALHASVGLNYDMSFDCVNASFGIGYEFSSYIRALTRVSFPDDVADSLSYNNYYNFDMQGLYVSGSLSF